MIQLKNTGFKRDDRWVLRNINLEVPQGSLIGVIGRSGIGKTTLLKLMSGFLDASEGEVVFENQLLKGPSIKLVPGYEEIQLVNQDFGLEPYHTVEQNIREKVLALHKEEQAELVEEFLDLLELQYLRDRQAHALSGGEQQRLSIARALACEPKVLLLDEPFVHLDNRLRMKVIRYLLDLNDLRNTSIVLVSHDGSELMGFVKQLIHVSKGSIERSGDAEELFYHPDTKEQGELLGLINELEIDGETLLFRPNEYKENSGDLKLTYQSHIDTGLNVFNYFQTENKEQVVLLSFRPMTDVQRIEIVKR